MKPADVNKYCKKAEEEKVNHIFVYLFLLSYFRKRRPMKKKKRERKKLPLPRSKLPSCLFLFRSVQKIILAFGPS